MSIKPFVATFRRKPPDEGFVDREHPLAGADKIFHQKYLYR